MHINKACRLAAVIAVTASDAAQPVPPVGVASPNKVPCLRFSPEAPDRLGGDAAPSGSVVDSPASVLERDVRTEFVHPPPNPDEPFAKAVIDLCCVVNAL